MNMNTFSAKLPYFIKVVWGLLVLFAFVGVVLGKSDVAVPVACIVAVMWVLLRIVFETFVAVGILYLLSVKPKDD